MRIPSGKTDQLIYFVAVDSTDLKTRETGLTSFTVYRSRNGGAATVYTTPTIAELSAANMPGVYSLTIDEDTTIAAGSDSEEYCVHITQAAMAPVTRTVELYRRDTTTGRTLAVDASSRALADVDTIKTNPVVNAGTVTFPTTATLASTTNITAGTVTTATNVTTVNGLAAAVITASSIAADAITDAKVSSDVTIASVTGAVGSVTGNVGGNVTGSVGSVVGAVGSVTGLTAATVHADLDDIQTRLPAALVSGRMDSSTGAMAANVLTAAATAADFGTEIAGAVWNEDATGHQTQGTFGQAIGDPAADTDSIWALANANLDAAVSSRMATYAQPAGFLAATFPGAVASTTNITAGTITTTTNLTNLPSIPANWLTAAGIAASALNGKGDWNIGKTGYSLTQAFPPNFSALSITAGGLADITQAAADKAWGTATRVLTAGTNIVLAKGVGVTGFNDLDAAGVASAAWNAATATHGTAGSYGLLIETNLDAAVSSRASQASVDTVDDLLDTEVAAIKAVTDLLPNGGALTALQADLDDIQTRLPAALVGGRIDASVGAMAANVMTAAAAAADLTAELQSGLSTLDAAAVRAAVGLAAANLDTQLGAVPTAAENAEALLLFAWEPLTVTDTVCMLNAMRFLRNRWNTTATPGSLTVYEGDGVTVAWTRTLATDAAAEPITGVA